MSRDKEYDSIVIGAGHAGAEAALAIARSGHQALLVTMKRDAICQMSCNPAIGGLAKGQMVREIDALGGEMGIATDQTALQFKMLNRSKGPAMWAPRAQADKERYRKYMTLAIESEKNIDLTEDQATELIIEGKKVIGIRTLKGGEFFSKSAVITTGTFMCGLMHLGQQNFSGGRRGESPSIGLSDSLREHGFDVIRFKTGTPCRIEKSSIDFSKCEEQRGDEAPKPFSFRTEKINLKQESCWLTHTNQKTHEIIRNNLHLSPLYSGRIQGIGPRYCPSIEDKVVKFSEKERHQIYLEPESLSTTEFYVNGLSTSLPAEIQADFIHTIPGLENAKIIKFGYAVEYDCMPPTQLYHSLETKKIEGLFFAGQVNCTSGYEEAAAQGLMAGINVVRKLKGQGPFILKRSEAYIGVLIDDLVTKGTLEPYRMFTSRAEHRLLLRQDNADERLMAYGHHESLISKEVFEKRSEIWRNTKEIIQMLESKKINNVSLKKILRRSSESFKTLPISYLQSYNLTEELIRKVELDVKYEGYITRQSAEVKRFEKLEQRIVPKEIDYSKVHGLSREAAEKFSRIKPTSIGHASRIPGITSCDVSILSLFIVRHF